MQIVGGRGVWKWRGLHPSPHQFPELPCGCIFEMTTTSGQIVQSRERRRHDLDILSIQLKYIYLQTGTCVHTYRHYTFSFFNLFFLLVFSYLRFLMYFQLCLCIVVHRHTYAYPNINFQSTPHASFHHPAVEHCNFTLSCPLFSAKFLYYCTPLRLP